MPNFVKDQFPSESLSSFQTSVTTAATAGPANTTAATLSNLAQSMENTPVGASVNVSHSVPNPLGNITSFAATIQQINEKLQQDPNNGKRYLEALANDDPIRAAKYNEWLGLCALVALRNVYSMNGLQVELVYEQFEDEPFDRAVYFSLKNMDYQYSWMAGRTDNITSGGMFYLKVNGQYIALYNLEVGLCPMQRYETDAWADRIPWFDATRSEDVHQCWQNPFEALHGNPYVLDRLANWLQINHGTAPVAVFYPALVAAPAVCLTLDWRTVQVQLDNVIQANVPEDKLPLVTNAAASFCTSYAAYLDRAGNACPMPDLLTESLFLADISDGGSCGLGYPVKGDTWDASWKQLHLESSLGQLDTSKVVPTVPFTEEGCEKLECGYGDGDYELKDISFCAYGDASQPLEFILVTITLFFPKTGETFAFEHPYLPGKIRIGLIPYLGVWPNAKMPENAGWKYYVATQTQSRASTFMDVEQERAKWPGTRPAKIELNLHGGNETQVCEKGINPGDLDKADCLWQITRNDVPFRFATVQYVYSMHGTAVKQPCGAVFVRKNETFSPQTTINYELAVDFGTTSTVCAVRTPAGAKECLPFKDYLQNVTVGRLEGEILPVEESRLLGTAPGEIGAVNQKTTLHQKKVMSVAQLFSNHTADLAPYVDGRFFLANSAILCRYIDGADFATRGIYNELKLAKRTDADVLDATAVYLAGIYLHALFYIMEQGGIVSQLKLSYPDKSYQLELSSRWETAGNIVNRCFAVGSPYCFDLKTHPLEFWTEANAANSYFNGMPSDIVVDIGGGTADLSLTGTDKTASVQFAGRELMINSIIEAYRHWHGNADLRDSSFAKMWGDPLGTGTQAAKPKLIREFNTRCAKLAANAPALQGALDDQTLRMLAEVLLNDYELDVKKDYAYSLFRSIITFKFGLLLSLIAQFILENQAQLTNPMKRVAGPNGMEYPLSIRFVGTAAKTLEHIFGEPLENIDSKTSNQNVVVAEMAGLLRKITGIRFQLTVWVSANVQEKKEVAFGMLSAAAGPVAAAATPAKTAIPRRNGVIPTAPVVTAPIVAAPSMGVLAGAVDNTAFMQQKICEIMWSLMENMDFRTRMDSYANVFGSWPPLDPAQNTEAEWKKVLQDVSDALAGVPADLRDCYEYLNDFWQDKVVNDSIQELQNEAARNVPEELNQMIDGAVSFCIATVRYGGIPAGLELGAGADAVSISDVMPNAVTGGLRGNAALSRKNLLVSNLSRIKGNPNNMKSLANQTNPAMRKKLLDVYLAASMLDDALSQEQI